jgi:hypothetical protein
MTIDKGDFVCMWRTGIPEWWCEVIQVMPLREVLVDGVKDHQYQVRYWDKKKNQWDYFHLAPHTAHRGMVKEVRKIPAEVVPMFRELFIKGESR